MITLLKMVKMIETISDVSRHPASSRKRVRDHPQGPGPETCSAVLRGDGEQTLSSAGANA